MKKLYFLIISILLTEFALAQPANDNCNNAEPITVSSEISTVNFDLTGATLNNEPGCDGTTESYADVWYSFTMPFDGNVLIDGTIAWNNIGATNACNGNLLACDNTELVLTDISANTNVLLRIFRSPNVADDEQFLSFTIRAFETPENNTCDTSINVPLGILQEQVSFDIAGSSINSENACSTNTTEYADVWYDFIMPFDGNLFLDGSNFWNKFEIFDACSGTSLYCGEDTLLAVGLTDNTPYKIRVYRSLEDMFTLNFLNFSILAYQASNNDDCSTAIALNLSETLTTITTPYLGGSTIENSTGCTADTMDYLDIWYKFTTIEQGDVTIVSGTNWNHFALYNACNSTSINCYVKDGTFANLPAGTYYLRVFRELAFATSPVFKNFDISSTAETLSTNEFHLQEILLFPNPASNYINIKTKGNIDKIGLYNLQGKLVLKTAAKNQINVSQLESGLYLLKMNTKSESITKKVLIQ